MKKEYVIGALALVGFVLVYNFVKKPKRNSEGFFGMDGRVKSRVTANCGRRNTDGSYSYYYAQDGQCKGGFKRVAYFGDRNI